MKAILVPVMLTAAGALMSFAWIGHLKYKQLPFWAALAASWLLVLPEYVLNVYGSRWGRDTYSGAQMAAMHLGAGVVCVALVAKWHLGEELSSRQLTGFALLGIAIALILLKE